MALAKVDRLPTGGALRMPLARRVWTSLLGVVGAPTVLALLYFGLIASDVYIAEAKFTIRGDRTVGGNPLELSLFGGGGGEDALIVRAYVLSHGIVAELDRQVGLRRAFADPAVDPYQRLSADASREELTQYFTGMVDVTFDAESSVTTLRVRAFTAEDAQRIAQAILDLSERLVNSLSERVTGDVLAFARQELERAEDRVAQIRRTLTAFRDRTDALDPTHEAGSILGIITNLEDRLAQERTELMQLRSYLREDSARVAAVKARIAALSAQVATERLRLTGPGSSRLSRVVADYEDLKLELEFAQNAYTSMLASLEAARAEAQKQQKYLIPVVAPDLPDEALEPRRLLGVATVLLGALVAYGVGALVLAAIREHADL